MAVDDNPAATCKLGGALLGRSGSTCWAVRESGAAERLGTKQMQFNLI